MIKIKTNQTKTKIKKNMEKETSVLAASGAETADAGLAGGILFFLFMAMYIASQNTTR